MIMLNLLWKMTTFWKYLKPNLAYNTFLASPNPVGSSFQRFVIF